jgi:hypothetical protein
MKNIDENRYLLATEGILQILILLFCHNFMYLCYRPYVQFGRGIMNVILKQVASDAVRNDLGVYA